MTEEKLEKEAEFVTKGWKQQKNCIQAYLAGAKPREKRIEELEAQIEKMKCCINDLVHLGEFNENTDEEYLNYQVHEALKNAEQFIKE